MRRTLLVLISIAAVVRAADKPKFAPGKAESYPGKQTSESITIAAIPYTSAEQTAAVFGKVKPYDEGILPVLVIVDNNTGKGLRLDLTAEFIDPDGQHAAAMSPSSVMSFHAIRKRPDAPRTNPLPRLPGSSNVKTGPLNTPEIEGRAFAVHLVPPGESAFGFFYFQANYLPGSKIYLNGLSDAASRREYFYFEVPIQKK